MSWDATLYAVTEYRNCQHCGHELAEPKREETEIGWWNYTSNTSRMIYDVLRRSWIVLAEDESWWMRLNGMSAANGKVYLTAIIAGLEADPEKYRAMNPSNGWGNYDGLLETLRQMRDKVPDEPSEWHCSG